MENKSNIELLRRYKRLCRKVIFTDSKKELDEAREIENELARRFNESNQIEMFVEYQKLIFYPVDTTTSSDEVLDKYYSSVVDLEEKLSKGSGEV